MGVFGRERVESHLQWSIVSQNLLAGYQTLFCPSTNSGPTPISAQILVTFASKASNPSAPEDCMSSKLTTGKHPAAW